MRILMPLLILGALLMPLSANALQLRWSTGETELTFESARLCTLVVEADETLGQVPYEWRVLWATDGCPLRPLTKNPQLQGDGNKADVCGVEWPKSASEVAANMSTAHFCSDGTDPATTARVVFDIPGGCRGKLLAVTIDPDDSTHVLSSAEVTFNGGTSRAYPPSVLRAAYTHNELDLTVEVTGTGLSSLENASLLSKDASWRFPLTVSFQSDQRLTATAQAAAAVPGCNLDLSKTTGEVGTIGVTAEEFDTPTSSLAGGGVLTDLNPRAYPKDFAFIHERGKFEVWYTRQHQETFPGSTIVVPIDSTTRALGHATSSNLQTWTVDDTLVLPVRNGRSPGAGKPVEPMKWDNWQVWAPSITKKGMTYYMHYTGVSRYVIAPNDTVVVQKIGLATSTDLMIWTRREQPILSTQQVSWAAKGQHEHGRELRDPFVMVDPNDAGQYIMYYTAVDTVFTKSSLIGYARSTDLENWVASVFPLRHTDKFNHFASDQDYPRVESPHLFFAQSKWWQLHTAHNGVSISLNSGTPYDVALGDSTHWLYSGWIPPFGRYYELLHKSVTAPNGSTWNSNGDLSLQHWYASEYLKVERPDTSDTAGRHEYLAAANDSIDNGGSQTVLGLEFREITWTGVQSFAAGSPTVTSVAASDVPISVGLHLLGFRPGQQGCEFRIDSPVGAHIRLILYDVFGRRLRTIRNGQVSAGATKIAWDGRDDAGTSVRSGVYFVRLESPFGRRVVRLPLVR